MSISDKARKILWGRSGNRCAICRHELVLGATNNDDESVVGEECHIVSGSPQGPRHELDYPSEHLDDPENLILLCRIHHKMVDDQCETYTVDLLRAQKANHEKWVSSKLTEDAGIPPVRVRRVKGNIPPFLVRLTSGQDLLRILDGALAYSFDHDAPTSEAEVELLSSFSQHAEDWGDISTELGAGERVREAYRMDELVEELEQAGFWVFVGREVRRLEGGVGQPSPFPIAIVRILRSTNPAITRIDATDRAPIKDDKSGGDSR